MPIEGTPEDFVSALNRHNPQINASIVYIDNSDVFINSTSGTICLEIDTLRQICNVSFSQPYTYSEFLNLFETYAHEEQISNVKYDFHGNLFAFQVDFNYHKEYYIFDEDSFSGETSLMTYIEK